MDDDTELQPPAGEEAEFGALYNDLLGLARAHFRDQPRSHTLQPTALVHEVFVKIAGSSAAVPTDREHLLGVACKAMRQVLVDHARKRKALKRGGGAGSWARVTLAGVGTDQPEWNVLELDELINRLGSLDPRQARLVELRFFGGLTTEQAARVLGVTERTAFLDWKMARAWLQTQLTGDE